MLDFPPQILARIFKFIGNRSLSHRAATATWMSSGGRTTAVLRGSTAWAPTARPVSGGSAVCAVISSVWLSATVDWQYLIQGG